MGPFVDGAALMNIEECFTDMVRTLEAVFDPITEFVDDAGQMKVVSTGEFSVKHKIQRGDNNDYVAEVCFSDAKSALFRKGGFEDADTATLFLGDFAACLRDFGIKTVVAFSNDLKMTVMLSDDEQTKDRLSKSCQSFKKIVARRIMANSFVLASKAVGDEQWDGKGMQEVMSGLGYRPVAETSRKKAAKTLP